MFSEPQHAQEQLSTWVAHPYVQPHPQPCYHNLAIAQDHKTPCIPSHQRSTSAFPYAPYLLVQPRLEHVCRRAEAKGGEQRAGQVASESSGSGPSSQKAGLVGAVLALRFASAFSFLYLGSMRASPRPLASILGSFALLVVLGWARPAPAQCPVGSKITIDYDIPGSGYTEESSNWATWNTSPCNGTSYRYLSHTVGDGSRKGKAIFTPTLQVAGHYRVVTGYRATSNRTTDADYFAYDDTGAVVHKVADQTQGDGCKWLDMGTFYCVPGGACRVVLDGTDDSQSDGADVTIYELVDCETGTGGGGGSAGSGGSPSVGRCDGIRSNPAWEVCEETATRCAGVFTDGAGCVAYCGAAAMTCTARFGGEKGCQKEPANVLGCGDNNGHASDWCECEGAPVQPDAGPAGAGGAAGHGAASGSAGSAGSTGGSAGSAGAAGWTSVGGGGADASAGGNSGLGGHGGGSGGTGGVVPAGSAKDGDDGGCACRSGAPRAAVPAAAIMLVVLLGAWARERRHGASC